MGVSPQPSPLPGRGDGSHLACGRHVHAHQLCVLHQLPLLRRHHPGPAGATLEVAGAPQAHQGEARRGPASHVPEAVRATPLPVWAPGAATAAMVRPAFAVCWALPGALCALAYPVLKAAPWGGCCECSHFTDRKIRLRHYGHAGFHEPTENRRPKTELKEKSSRLHINP